VYERISTLLVGCAGDDRGCADSSSSFQRRVPRDGLGTISSNDVF